MDFLGVPANRLAKEIDLRVEVALGIEPPIDFRNESGQLLTLLFLDVELERLEQRMAGVPFEKLPADAQRRRDVLLGEVAPRFGVAVADGFVL